MAEHSSESDQELHDIYPHNASVVFVYDDPLLATGVIQAVMQADLNKVKALVIAGRSANINDNHGNTPLHVAVINNLPEIADFLLTCDDVNVNCKNFYGETALFLAGKRGYLNLVEILIKADCDVNLPTLEDMTPLHISVKYPKIVEKLIVSGAEMDATDYSGETVLHEAINEQNLETLCMLLYYGADPNIPCNNGITPFMKAICFDDVDFQAALFDYVTDFNAVTKDGMTLLNLALTHTCPHVREIIERGADVNHENEHLNAFIMCLRVPNVDNFTLVWKDFKYQKLHSNLSYVEQIINALEENDVHMYLRVIINSNNLAPLFVDFDFFPLYNFVTYVVIDKGAWSDIVHELLFLYASHGYSLSGDIIGQLFEMYGYTDLLYACLHMDLDLLDNSVVSFARFLFDTRLPTKRFGSILAGGLENFSMLCLTSFFQFFRFPRLTHIHNMNFTEKYKADLKKLCQLPSLLELSRNATRDHLILKFDLLTSKQYFLFLQNMKIANTYKSILSFRLPIYE
ncbi:ankyrin-2-like isoform X1 [Euwallacea similis]|uniref:ankyrin-2-like isoform X1 n=1 Tax=Euwallacea similis TaxID=1736056 RepID=UPI00344B1A11